MDASTGTKPARKSPRVSASQKVEAYIKRAIYQGQLRPRERIIEDDLARQLQCSRGPVREALLRLERDGLIITTPRRGTFIRDISPEEIEVIFSIRAKLEGLCVRYMREAASPQSETALRESLRKMKAAAAKNDDEQFFYADMELHHTIWKASQRERLYRTLSSLMNPFMFMVARSYSDRVPIADRYKNHESYVEMILTTPLGRVEREVERYFGKLYERVFQKFRPAFHLSAGSLWPGGFPEQI